MPGNANRFYEALLEGRYPFSVEVNEAPEGDSWVATYTGPSGAAVTATESSQAEAHRRCTELVVAGIQDGSITPY